MKAKRSFYNIFYGFISQIITIAFGIIIPKLFILKFGSEVNGFVTSITQIFIYISLLEAGVGAATIQSLYKPISIDDKDGINSILSATSRFYKKTGCYYLLAVIVTSIAYPLFFKSEISNLNMFLVIIFTGIVGVINYFFQAKFKLFLTTEGKSYIVTNISMIVNVLINIAKIVLLYQGYNVVVIQFTYFILNFLQIIMIWAYIKKNYKWLDLNVKPNYEAISQKNSVLIHQISGMIFNNTDVFILTIFCGFKVVSIYVMYNLIFQMINSIVANLNAGLLFIFGSTYFEDRNKFLKLYNSYELYYVATVFALYSITYILILPFMRLYTAGMDINYIDSLLPILFVVLNLLSYARTPGVNAITVAGHFSKTQSRTIIESTINIVASLICVNLFGIYGVLLGTIVALLYRTNDIILYTSKYILKTSSLSTYKRWLINSVLFLAVVGTATKLKIEPTSYVEFVLSGFVLSIIVIPLFYIVVSIFDIKSFKYTLGYVKIYVNKFMNKLKKEN